MADLFPLWPWDLLGIAAILSVHLAFRGRGEKAQFRALWLLCLLDFAGWLVNDLYGLARGQDIRTMIPLQLCNIAVFLLPVSLIARRRILWDLLFYVCALGALAALLFPSTDYLDELWSGMTAGFFVNHLMILAIPLLLAAWGIYRPEPTPGRLASLSLLVFALASALHLVNLGMHRAWGVEADYFFTIIRLSAPQNPVFAFFATLIPLDLFYLLPALPILWISAPLMALPWNWRRWAGRPARRP